MVTRNHVVDEKDPGAGPAPRSARWVVPHALAMGLCQTVMLAELLLGPVGLGFGGTVWGSPGLATAFFAALSVAMTTNELLSRRGVGRLELRPSSALAFSAGMVLLVVARSVFPGFYFEAGLAGAAMLGYGTACAQLSSARFLSRLDSVWRSIVVLLSTSVSALLLLLGSLCDDLYLGLLFAASPPAALVLEYIGAVPNHALASKKAVHVEVLGAVTPGGATRAGLVMGCTTAFAVLVLAACGGGLAADAIPGRHVAACAGFLSVCVVGLMAVSCFKTKTLSMTFLFRLSLPCVFVSAVLAVFAAASMHDGLFAVTALLAAGSAFFIDQITWVTTASFMRSADASGETTASRLRSLQYAGACVGVIASSLVLGKFDLATVMLVGAAVMGCAFVLGIPAREARLISVGAQLVESAPADAGLLLRHADDFDRYGLTNRESEVACLMMEGLDAPAMADRLVVSRATINTHVRHIYEKTGAHCREEMLALFDEVPE